MKSRTKSDQIEELELKKRKLEARIRAVRGAAGRERRRKDARLKIIVGALVLRHRVDLVPQLVELADIRDQEFVASAFSVESTAGTGEADSRANLTQSFPPTSDK